jgi:hypothetical protein
MAATVTPDRAGNLVIKPENECFEKSVRKRLGERLNACEMRQKLLLR